LRLRLDHAASAERANEPPHRLGLFLDQLQRPAPVGLMQPHDLLGGSEDVADVALTRSVLSGATPFSPA
jgi:hypothetical protein